MGHQDDHIRREDESFKYRGRLVEKLVKRFTADENKPRILNLQGFIACGKTRTSKKFVRLLAQKLREQDGGPNEVHTFLFDLRHQSRESLLNSIQRRFKDKVTGWKSHGDIESVDELSYAFEREKERAYVIILDNVDRVNDNERPDILDFIQKLSLTDNVYMVLTSRIKVNLVRIRDKVMDECMKPMDPEDAKELLRETSGNPENLDAYADEIIDLVCRSPLALIIAGHEMNGRYTSLPYTPKQFVGVMTDSMSLSINLENVPTEDQIISRVADIVKTNFSVLEKLVVALDCPQMFNTEDLENAVAATNGSPLYEGQIKQTILHVVLKRSLYGLNEETKGEDSLESAPFLMEVLKETFCQMTSKDGFLKEFNKNLVNTHNDMRRHLMRSVAQELRQAEIHLLRNQKRPKVTSQEVQVLRKNVIRKASEFLDRVVEADAKTLEDFETSCFHNLNEWEEAEGRRKSRSTRQGAIQETRRDQQEQAATCSGSPSRMSPTCIGQEKESEACLSPTFPSDIALPGLKEINEANATAKTPATEAGNLIDISSDGARKVDATDPQKGGNRELEHIGNEKKRADVLQSCSPVNTTLQMQSVIPKSTFRNKMGVTEERSTSDVDLNKDKDVTTVSQTPLNACTNSVPSNLFTDESSISLHLGKTFDRSMSLCAQSPPGSLHSNDCTGPIEESLPSHATYSALPTIPDNHVLYTSSSNLESTEGDDRQPVNDSNAPTEMPTKEAVESEFNWEHGDSNEVIEASEGANADQKPCDAVTRAEGDEDHPGDKTKHEVSKPKLLHQVSTTTTTTTTTRGTPNHSETGSHPPWQQSNHTVQKSETRGRGILGSAPSSSSSAFPASSQGYMFPSHYYPVPDQNISFTPTDRVLPSHRGYVNGNLQGQEQRQMMPPIPFQPPYGQQETYHDQAYTGGPILFNQFDQEYNQAHYQASLYNYPTNNLTHQDFTNTSDRNLQARGPPLQSCVFNPSPSFQPQGPSYGFPQAQRPTPSSSFRAQASSDRISHARGPPLRSNDVSLSSSFRPQGPPLYSPPHSLRTNGHPPPSGYSNDVSLSSSFRPQGPPLLSPPHSLRTRGFNPFSGYSNGTQDRSNQRDYGHQSTPYHQHGQYPQQSGYPHQRNGHY